MRTTSVYVNALGLHAIWQLSLFFHFDTPSCVCVRLRVRACVSVGYVEPCPRPVASSDPAAARNASSYLVPSTILGPTATLSRNSAP